MTTLSQSDIITLCIKQTTDKSSLHSTHMMVHKKLTNSYHTFIILSIIKKFSKFLHYLLAKLLKNSGRLRPKRDVKYRPSRF